VAIAMHACVPVSCNKHSTDKVRVISELSSLILMSVIAGLAFRGKTKTCWSPFLVSHISHLLRSSGNHVC